MINVCLDRMIVLRMIAWIRSREEFYDGSLEGFFLPCHVQLFLYVGLYKNVDVDDWHEAGFL